MNKEHSLTPKIATERILKHKIGIYPYHDGTSKVWRFVIQYHGKHIARYFKTKKEAKNHWVFMYCRIHGVKYESVLRKLPKTQFYNITRIK